MPMIFSSSRNTILHHFKIILLNTAILFQTLKYSLPLSNISTSTFMNIGRKSTKGTCFDSYEGAQLSTYNKLNFIRC